MTMAVGIIIGSAFTAIVTSLNQDIITPLLGLVLGQINFAGLPSRDELFKLSDKRLHSQNPFSLLGFYFLDCNRLWSLL